MMEFQIRLAGPAPDMGAVGAAIRSLDPSGIADIDAAGGLLRVAATIDAAELIVVLNKAGLMVEAAHVRSTPSICCGGCGS